MLYLEDYLEMIEHLPQELRDRFTEMREMDLQVQNAMDRLDQRVKDFFTEAKKLKPAEREIEYEKIRQDYYKALEDADEKVHLANQIYDLVERYLRKLDQELQKFKMELEADNAGITEVLERRSLELDNPPTVNNSIMMNSMKSEKRKHVQTVSATNYTPEKQGVTEKVLSLATEVMRETIAVNRGAITGLSPSSTSSSSSSTSSMPDRTATLPQSKAHPFGGGNALAAAASQAIAATQQSLKRGSSQSQSNIVQQGRRTASLKASYEAVNSGLQSLSKDFILGAREIASVVSTPSVSGIASVMTEPKTKNKKSRSSQSIQQAEPPPPMEDSGDSSLVDESGMPAEWNFDPNEPRYCICNNISYGDMVACDNEDCPFEWFHYSCVGITQPPKGKWFCPQCTTSMRRRGRKDK